VRAVYNGSFGDDAAESSRFADNETGELSMTSCLELQENFRPIAPVVLALPKVRSAS
jgi:hypothetical protein